MSSAPIADLSYRGYDGPLEPPINRWQHIAKMGFRRATSNRACWTMMFLSGFYFVIMIIFLVVTQQQAANMAPPVGAEMTMPNPFEQLMKRLVWKDQFLHGISTGQMFFMILVLIFGVGSIANDNRSNALLVYLSKPCTKLDYIVGKFMGIFLPLLMFMVIPTLVFYLYGIASFRDYGFFSDDPLLFPKAILALIIQAAFLTSLAVGISSVFNQGRLAGATFAGLYFITLFITNIMGGIHMMGRDENEMRPFMTLIKNLFYASIDGQNIGATKLILGTGGTPMFGMDVGRDASSVIVPRPDAIFIWGPMIVLSVLSLLLAWRRVRAVEVVG